MKNENGATCSKCQTVHPWLSYLAGQDFQCACGEVLQMPQEALPSSDEGELLELADDLLVSPIPSVPKPASPLPIESSQSTAGSKDEYELEDEPMIPPLPVAPAPQARPVQSDTSVATCPKCSQQFGAVARACPHCGFSPSGQKKPSEKPRQPSRRNETDEPRVLFSVGSMPFSFGKLVVFLALLGGLLGGLYWFVTGPAASFSVVDQRVVHATQVIPMTIQMRGSLVQGMGSALTGGASGGGDGTSAGNATLTRDPGRMAAGQTNILTAIRNDKTGQNLLVSVGIQKKLMEIHGQTSGYDMVLVASAFELRVGQKTYPARLLAQTLPLACKIDLAGASTSEYRHLLPSGKVPDKTSWGQGRTPPRGTVTYDGTMGVQGELDYIAYAIESNWPGASGLFAEGALTMTDANGIVIDYKYNGDNMVVTAPNNSEMWRAIKDEKIKASWSPWHKYYFSLLFDLPAKEVSGPWKIYFMNEHVATLRH